MGSYTGTVPTILSGDIAPASDFTELTNLATALTAAWTSAAPTWTASAGVPAVGNGTLTGRYRRVGKTVDFQFRLTAGSTTTFGTGGATFQWTIPGGGTAAETQMGKAWYYDASTGFSYPCQWKIDAAATAMRVWLTEGSPALELTNTGWATSDQFIANGTVEIA